MNERDWADRFTHDVDNLLNEAGRTDMPPQPANYRQALEMARLLTTTDFSDETDIRDGLRHRLLSQIDQQQPHPFATSRRFFATLARPSRLAAGLAGAALLVAVLALFASWLALLSHPVAQPEQPTRETVAVAGLPEPTQAPEPTQVGVPGEEGRRGLVANAPGLGRLAYVQDGDIWVKALPDGEPRRVTSDGDSRQPRWSPSGQWLAYRRDDDQVWVVPAGSPLRGMPNSLPVQQGGAVSDFAWSPVADVLAFSQNNTLQLFNPTSAGQAQTLVSVDPQQGKTADVRNAYWSPDGSSIAYNVWQRLAEAGQEGNVDQGIWISPVAGGEPMELYNSGAPQVGEAILAGWSADGRFLLFWQSPILSASILMDGVPLYALPATDGEPLALGSPGADGFGLPVLVQHDYVTSAPQGSQVAAQPVAAIAAGGGRETWRNKGVGIADLETGDVLMLTPGDTVAFSPAWSPDGRSLAYVSMPDAGNVAGGDPAWEAMLQRHIEVADLAWLAEQAAGGAMLPNDATSPPARQLTNDPAYRDERPLWSADGSQILFARIDQDEQASLWLVPVEGGEVQQMAERLSPPPANTGWFGVYGHVDWSQYYDWWRGPAAAQPQPTATPPSGDSPVTATPAPPIDPPASEGATANGRFVYGYADSREQR